MHKKNLFWKIAAKDADCVVNVNVLTYCWIIQLMDKTFNTIIVGAGPGGLSAGRYLKDAIILDQKKEIGLPVQCAEGLSKRFLDKMNISPDPEWISATIDTTQIVLPNGKEVNLYSPGQSYVIDRKGFERFLARMSQAEICLGQRVIDIEKQGEFWEVKTKQGRAFRSRYLIGADGPFSIVREKVFGQKIRVLPVVEYLVELTNEIDTSKLLIYFDRGWLGTGYAWIFPKSKNRANIGLGSVEKKDSLNELLRNFLENRVREKFGPYRILENRSSVGPWVKELMKVARDNALLVGDAAGLVDTISGGGIGNAMLSGRLAAEAILKSDLSSYQDQIQSLFPNDLFKAQKILYSFDNQTLNELGQVLERKNGDIFYLKSPRALLAFLFKPHLRKNILGFLELFLIYTKWKGLNA